MIPVCLRAVGHADHRRIMVLALAAGLLASGQAFSASPRDFGYEYLSPLPGARLVSPWNNVVLRPAGAIDAATVSTAALSVVGSRSGVHAGRLGVSDDQRTLVFNPERPFTENESVTVTLAPGIRMRNGAPLPSLSFAFSITPRDPQRSPQLVPDEMTGALVPFDRLVPRDAAGSASPVIASQTSSDSLPPGMPVVTLMTSNLPDPGDLFLAPFGFTSGGNLMILDNKAQPMFYRKLPGPAFDFKRQPNGLLTYFTAPKTFWALDSSYAVVDSFRAGNGYSADLHDLQLLPDGHALLLIYDVEPVPLDTVVPGGRPDAKVIGLVVQELDKDKSVVFQWRSWDHFQVTDADPCLINMRDSLVDCVHGNAVELDADGNLLISARSMNEITKIDHATGDIIWRWGLHAVNNQFTFANDSRGFTGQHDIRRLPNGNVTLFDNGNCLDPVFSRGVEYQLDEVNKIATLVTDFRDSPDTYTPFMGNVQRRDDGGTTIGWGGTGTDPKLTDVHPDGSLALAFGFGAPTTWTYRAFRFPWQTSRFAVAPEMLDYGTLVIGKSDTLSLTVLNRSNAPVTITSVVGHVAAFSVVSPLPMTLAPGQSDSVRVCFLPPDLGRFSDTLYVRSCGPTELVAQSVTVTGTCEANGIWIEDMTQFEGHSGLAPFHFRVRIAAPLAQTVSVRYMTLNGTAKLMDSDYVGTSGRAYIVMGDTATWLTVSVRGDNRVEPDEKFYVSLYDPLNVTIDRGQAAGTIMDDDRLADVGEAAGLPLDFALYPPSPNPGRGAATLHYDLPRTSRVRLEVFDLSGRRIRSLVDDELPAGRHEATWTPKAGEAGVFFYRLRAGDFDASYKMVLVR